MAFESDVVVREIDATTWKLVESLRYSGNRETFVVPAGFETDFASVPRAFVWLIPTYGRYTKAAILHDFLCEEAKVGRFDRDDADGLFRRAMRELGVSFLRRWIMWGAVALATQWMHVRDVRRLFTKRFAQLIAVAIPGVAFFVVPGVVITVWLGLFWIAEAIAYLVLLPFSHKSHKKVNPPRFTWRMS